MAILNAIFIFVMLLNVCLLDSQIVQSPCRYFEYRTDENGYTYGHIKIDLDGAILGVSMIIHFTISNHNLPEYPGSIEYLGLRDSAVTYKVHFAMQQPMPKITQLVANNRLLCEFPGDTLRPGVYVSTFDLIHQVTFRSSELSSIDAFSRPSKPVNTLPDNNVSLSKDTTSWNAGYVINSPRSEPTGVSRKPTPVIPKAPESPAYRPEINRPEFELNLWDPSVSPRQPVTDYLDTASNPQETPSIPGQHFSEMPLTVQRVPTPSLPMRPAYALPSTNSAECGIVPNALEALPLVFQEAAFEAGEWPWLVAIYITKDVSPQYICAGSLVSDMCVVTAAHCMSTLNSHEDFIVRAGVHNLENWDDENSVTRTLASARKHESYSAQSLANDILILTFIKGIEFTPYIRPICLWEGIYDQEKVVGKYGVVAGWGHKYRENGRREPRMFRLEIVRTNTCRKSNSAFERLTSNYTLCAGGRDGTGPCLGDSGAGLYVREEGRWKLRGVTSFSLQNYNDDENNCNLYEYLVFTDAAQYSAWIIDSMISNYDK